MACRVRCRYQWHPIEKELHATPREKKLPLRFFEGCGTQRNEGGINCRRYIAMVMSVLCRLSVIVPYISA